MGVLPVTTHHLRRLVIVALAVVLPLAATSIGVAMPKAAAAAVTGTSMISATAPKSQQIVKAAAPADDSTCVTPGAICLPDGDFTVTYTVTITGSGDCAWTADIDWGDGTTDTVNYGDAGFTEEHHYTDPGLYDVSVTGSGVSTDPDGTCTFYPYSAEVEVPLSCTHTYQTTVTEYAGNDNGLPHLFSDKVTFSWCTDGNGHVQILSSSQDPTVEQSGFSFFGAQIALLKAVGLTFGVTPATAPTPAITNEPDFTSASTTASGLSFNEDLNLGQDLVALAGSAIGGAITERLAAELVVLIRSGRLGSISATLLRSWGAIATSFGVWAAQDFGLPRSWATAWLKNLPIDEIVDEVKDLGTEFATTAAETLQALNTNVTLGNVIDAVQSAIQKIGSALDFTTVDWAPQITVTVNGGRAPSADDVNDTNSKEALDIFVERPPIVMTTPES
jgi:hypothetical protein